MVNPIYPDVIGFMPGSLGGGQIPPPSLFFNCDTNLITFDTFIEKMANKIQVITAKSRY